MKYLLFYNYIFALLFLFLLMAVFAISAEEINIEKKFKEITTKLRCMTCQNQNIYESDTDFSKDLKKIIKNELSKGKNEGEIIDFVVKRYGEYILFEPKVDKKNILLWTFPFILLFLSIIFLIMRINKYKFSK